MPLFRVVLTMRISIHALREEGDNNPHYYKLPLQKFLSTPSARRATVPPGFPDDFYYISIHALREEGDARATSTQHPQVHFYPRPPRGGRRTGAATSCHSGQFLSTPSARRATDRHMVVSIRVNQFLSTPSARRATFTVFCWQHFRPYFYPRPPRGGRRLMYHRRPRIRKFLSTPSARRATYICAERLGKKYEFLSTPSARRATVSVGYRIDTIEISIHALREEGDLYCVCMALSI